ncbi:MAG: alpha/beta fold hydrolase [Candidatus Eremiobacteraeota bacterium]|nr:alpha/beta fold hydrolase [Candidatus Eremiobacteraeota bacterium]
MIALPASRPAQDYAEALTRARAFMALDDDTIMPQARTVLLEGGKPSALAVVLFHGITNNPAQYAQLAPAIAQRGVNVFVPRMPEHGDKDRMTNRLSKLTAETLLTSANEAVDIACGLGERVALLGISMGGTIAAYFGQHRSVALAVPVAPDFALLQLPYGVSRLLARIVLFFPNFFFWWDPRARIKQRPLTAYPRCSTHALMQTLRSGDDVYASAKTRKPLADRLIAVVNRCDPAVNNEATADVCREWSASKPGSVSYVEMRNLPENHDIIDPANPLARTDLVYPKLLEVLGLS